MFALVGWGFGAGVLKQAYARLNLYKYWELSAMQTFDLPSEIADLIAARNKVRSYYQKKLLQRSSDAHLKFTLDGNLVGDIGEALAVELFDIRLVSAKSTQGIDGYAPDGKTTVQIKATGTGRGPAFRQTEVRADHLIFFDLDFENAKASVLYNGPEHYAVSLLPEVFPNQRSLTNNQIRRAAGLIQPHEQLPIMKL
ncbi:hypothetical protein BH11PSE5_BH11PSE5_23570 [soil metagenome]